MLRDQGIEMGIHYRPGEAISLVKTICVLPHLSVKIEFTEHYATVCGVDRYYRESDFFTRIVNDAKYKHALLVAIPGLAEANKKYDEAKMRWVTK
jgi:hypothetical protein